MSTNDHTSTLEIPDGITVTLEERTISVKGKLGTVKKDFTKLPAFLTIENNTVKIEPYGTRRKDFAISKTAQSIINNMIKAVISLPLNGCIGCTACRKSLSDLNSLSLYVLSIYRTKTSLLS